MKNCTFSCKLHENRILIFKILRFYTLKIAANGGRHFEISIKTENYSTQFISQKHENAFIINKWDLCLLYKKIILWVNFINIVLLLGIIGKNQYPLFVSDVTT